MRINELYDNGILTILKKNCKSFFDEIGGQHFDYVLYRGSNDYDKASKLSLHTTRQDRLPSATNQWMHTLYNRYFTEQFGIPYRSAAVFATGSKSEAASYGDVHKLFPVGEFEFCWSPICADLYEYAQSVKLHHVVNEFINDGLEKEAYEYVKEELNGLHYRTTDLIDAISSHCEVMIYCKQYYLVDANVRLG